MAVRIPGGALRAPLGEEVPERRGERGRMPRVLDRSGTACGEAAWAVAAPQPEGPTGGRQGPACAIGPHGIASDRRKTQVCGAPSGPKPPSGRLYGRE